MNVSSIEPPPRSRTKSSGGPTASTLPECIIEMRSQRSASFEKRVERKIVTSSARERSIKVRQSASRATGSTPERLWIDISEVQHELD